MHGRFTVCGCSGSWVPRGLGCSQSLLPLLQWKQIPHCQLKHRNEVQVSGKKEEGFSVLGFLCLAVPAPHVQALAELPGSAAHSRTTESGGTSLHWDAPALHPGAALGLLEQVL